jgi:hypothetical protein
MTKDKIKAGETYTMIDIVRGGMFPWAKSFWSVRNVVALDQRKTNILKPLIVGEGRATKYFFKGANIIKFITAVEAGKVRL